MCVYQFNVTTVIKAWVILHLQRTCVVRELMTRTKSSLDLLQNLIKMIVRSAAINHFKRDMKHRAIWFHQSVVTIGLVVLLLDFMVVDSLWWWFHKYFLDMCSSVAVAVPSRCTTRAFIYISGPLRSVTSSFVLCVFYVTTNESGEGDRGEKKRKTHPHN